MKLLYWVLLWSVVAAIFFNLFAALYYLITKKGHHLSVVMSLRWRVLLSLTLIGLLVLGAFMGWVQPHTL